MWDFYYGQEEASDILHKAWILDKLCQGRTPVLMNLSSLSFVILHCPVRLVQLSIDWGINEQSCEWPSSPCISHSYCLLAPTIQFRSCNRSYCLSIYTRRSFDIVSLPYIESIELKNGASHVRS